MIDLAELVRRATGGDPSHLDAARLFKPSSVYSLLNEPFNIWCDYHAPQTEKEDETTRFERLRMQWGIEFEERWVKEHYPEAVKIRGRWGMNGLTETFKAMLRGMPAIHSPHLWFVEGEVCGKGDLLERCDAAASDLGPFYYRVKEVKRSSNVKEYHKLQAVVYNRILSRLQGYHPESVDIVLERGTVPVPVDAVNIKLDKTIDQWREIRDREEMPELPAYNKGTSPWRIYANRLLKERQDLTLCPAISSEDRIKLRERLGITQLDELARLKQEDFEQALGPRYGLALYYKYLACKTGKPYFLHGVNPSIPRRSRHFYFDFETCSSLHPVVAPHIYMIGVYSREQDHYKVFVAKGPGEEEKILDEFLADIGDPKDACLYHWHPFEKQELGKIIRKYPRLGEKAERLLDACIDLKEVIKNDGVSFATKDYSLKNVAPAVGFRGWQDDVDANEAMVLYWEWLEDQDPSKIARITTYNEDDCRAMVHIDQALQDIQPSQMENDRSPLWKQGTLFDTLTEIPP